MSMSQPAISSGFASRPMPRCFAAPVCVTRFDAFGAAATFAPIIASAITPNRTRLRHFDIFNFAVLLHVPGLDAVVVVDRIDAAIFAELGLARLHVSGLIRRARLQQQLAAVPVELVIKARKRLVPRGPVDLRWPPVASAVERDVDTRDPAAAGPRNARQHREARLVLDRR